MTSTELHIPDNKQPHMVCGRFKYVCEHPSPYAVTVVSQQNICTNYKKKKPTQTGFYREFLNIPTIKKTLSTHLRILAASSKRITTNSIYFEKNTVHKLLFAIIQRSDLLITTDCII